MIEKVIIYVKGLVLMSALVFILASCSQGASEEPEPVLPETPNQGDDVLKSDSVMVSFVPQSLEWSVSPMSRASSDDLYAILVYQSNNRIKDHSGTNESAIALFDDVNLISLKLSKSQYYHFVMVYVPNGKNVIEKISDTMWGSPFRIWTYPESTPQLNSVLYALPLNTVGFVDSPSHSKGIGTTNTGGNYNMVNEVLRYMGVYRNFKPEENNQKVPIQLYRWQYGIKITASDFHEGSVKLMTVLNKESRVLTMASSPSGTSAMEYKLEFPTYLISQGMLAYDNAGDYADNAYINGNDMKVVYTTSNGDDIILWSSNGSFPFKRMKMHTLEFSLSEAITNGGIKPDIMDSADAHMEIVSWNFY